MDDLKNSTSFKGFHLLYVIAWLLFTSYILWGLLNEKGSVLLVSFGYWITYIVALYYESWRMRRALKDCNSVILNQVRVSFVQNPFKWRKTLMNLESRGAIENEILKNINSLMLIHLMNIGLFFIVPVLLYVAKNL